MVTIKILLHPLAWRVLKRDCPPYANGIDVTHHWIYNFLRLQLEKEDRVTPTAQRITPSKFVEGYVTIYPNDLKTYGCHVSRQSMVNLSNAICDLERERLCHTIMTAHVFGGFPLIRCIRSILGNADFEHNEINIEQLRKHYQRHCQNAEELMYIDFQSLTDFKRNKH